MTKSSIITTYMASEYPHAEIGKRLRILRKSLGYSQKDFAAIHNWGSTQLINWETGHRRITVEAATKLRQDYGITLDWLYLGENGGLTQNLIKALSSRDDEAS